MRIFKKVVIDMASGGISQKESEWTDDYQGPICELKGGGGGTEPDYTYNAGMLKISEEQQAMADEMFNLFKYGVTYNPTEKIHGGGKVINPEWDAWDKRRKAQATKQGGMLWGDRLGRNLRGGRMKKNVGDPPPEKWIDDPDDWVLAGEQQGYDPDAVVSEMELMQGMIKSQAELLPYQEESQKARLEASKERSGVLSSIYKDALTGVDVNKRVSESRAGIQHAFKGTQGTLNRQLSRMGVDPTSGRGISMLSDIGINKAKAMAGAEAGVRTEAEREDFMRKTAAAGLPI